MPAAQEIANNRALDSADEINARWETHQLRNMRNSGSDTARDLVEVEPDGSRFIPTDNGRIRLPSPS